MDVKILGTGCPRCQRLEELTREAAQELGVSIEVEHVRDMERIMAYPVIGTPALVVDGTVRASGRMPSKTEIASWLQPG